MHSGKRTTILLATKSSGVRTALAAALVPRFPNLDLREVGDVFALVRELVERPPDVLLVGGSLLFGDHLTAIRHLQELAPGVDVIVITSSGVAPYSRALDAAGVRHVALPSALDELPTVVAEALTARANGPACLDMGYPSRLAGSHEWARPRSVGEAREPSG